MRIVQIMVIALMTLTMWMATAMRMPTLSIGITGQSANRPNSRNHGDWLSRLSQNGSPIAGWFPGPNRCTADR